MDCPSLRCVTSMPGVQIPIASLERIMTPRPIFYLACLLRQWAFSLASRYTGRITILPTEPRSATMSMRLTLQRHTSWPWNIFCPAAPAARSTWEHSVREVTTAANQSPERRSRWLSGHAALGIRRNSSRTHPRPVMCLGGCRSTPNCRPF